MKYKRYFFLFPLVSVLSTHVEAYEPSNKYDGTEKPTTVNDSGCATFKMYSVITLEDDDYAGENIKVFKGSTCDPKKSRKVLYLKNKHAYWFAGLFESYLFVDSGTGPDGSDVLIYDLIKKKLVYSETYSSKDNPRIKDGKLIFYKELGDLSDKENRHCPGAKKWLQQGLNYGFEQKTIVDLKSMTEKTIGKISCSVRQ